MIRERLEEARALGEKISEELVRNPYVLNTLVTLIRSKEDVTRSLQKTFDGALQRMNIPTQQEIKGVRHQVLRLERDLGHVVRKFLRRTLLHEIEQQEGQKRLKTSRQPLSNSLL